MILGLFFSRGVSLELWLKKGLFDREKLIYEKYLNDSFFNKIYWFTYGIDDEKIANDLKQKKQLHSNIIVISMPKSFKIPKIGSYIYSLILPFIQKKYLKECDAFKTNQSDGSWSAVIAKKLYSKKLLYRTGYTISQLENNLGRFNPFILKSIEAIESFAYKNCDKAIVASNHNLEYVLKKYNLSKTNIDVLYNFIDENRFFDMNKQREEKITFVGRLSSEKNILNLIKASKQANLKLEIYGSGILEKELKDYIKKNNCNVNFMGNIANNELPNALNNSKYYALVSLHEGMPKALIEAMAAGCLCIGTNVSGINEVILDNYNGILAKDTTDTQISLALKKCLNMDINEQNIMKKNASEYIKNNFTLTSIYEKEKTIFEGMLNV